MSMTPDLEAHLRALLRERTVVDRAMIYFWLNNENRVQLEVRPYEGKPGHEYLAVGNQTLPIQPKPPTQTAGVVGIDAFGGMGARP